MPGSASAPARPGAGGAAPFTSSKSRRASSEAGCWSEAIWSRCLAAADRYTGTRGSGCGICGGRPCGSSGIRIDGATHFDAILKRPRFRMASSKRARVQATRG